MLQKNNKNVYDFRFHLVFVTKYRQPVFNTDEKRRYVEKTLTEIATARQIKIQSIDVHADYIHVYISCPPKESPTNVMKSFKGSLARQYFNRYPNTQPLLWGGHLWSPSFFMTTVEHVSKEVVINYVKSQMTVAMQRQIKYQQQKNAPKR